MCMTIDKRQKVLDTALDMILENDIQSASMGKISKASGVAVGTMYHHFASKEVLITELYRQKKGELFEALQIDINTESIEEYFYIALRTYIRFAEENKKGFEFIERYHMSPIIDQEVRSSYELMFYQHFKLLLDFFKSKSNLKNLTDELILAYVTGALSGLIAIHVLGKNHLSEEQIKEYISVIWNGLSN